MKRLISTFWHHEARNGELSLRLKIMLLIIAPVLTALVLLSFIHYFTSRQLLQANRLDSSVKLGDLLLRTMRQSMLINSTDDLTRSLADITTLDPNNHAMIMNPMNIIKYSSNPEELEKTIDVAASEECYICHRYKPGARPRAVVIGNGNSLRVATPILNEPACEACHQTTSKYLGILVIDVSLEKAQQRLLNTLARNLFISLLFTAAVVVTIYFLIDRLVVVRVEKLHNTIRIYTEGDFTARQPISKTNLPDELTDLAVSFNQMAEQIDQHQKEQRDLAAARQKAIVDERERIARELHDGVAQFIGYVSTKTMAARLLLQKGQVSAAEDQLSQIGQAVEEQSVDIRASIIGLKLVTQSGEGLAKSLSEYIAQCNRLSELPIQLEITPCDSSILLDAETELHLVRIIQEAISNILKHSKARSAHVSLQVDNAQLVLRVQDDGIGFNPWQWSGGQPHFGLQTMRERAEIIGAKFSVMSQPGSGTIVMVSLKMKED